MTMNFFGPIHSCCLDVFGKIASLYRIALSKSRTGHLSHVSTACFSAAVLVFPADASLVGLDAAIGSRVSKGKADLCTLCRLLYVRTVVKDFFVCVISIQY